MKGKLIVIEGGDGAGKATQTKRLVERLQTQGYSTATMDFPGYDRTLFGKILKDFLGGRFGDPKIIDPFLSSALFALDRYESKDLINIWLKEGIIVVLNRYLTSNIIHQGAKIWGQNKGIELFRLIREINSLERGFLRIPPPDLVIFLHVRPEIAQALMEKRGRPRDGHENDLGYAKKVEKTALWCCRHLNWDLVECSPEEKMLSEEDIGQKVWRHISRFLAEEGEK